MRERKRSRWSAVMSVGDSFGEGGRRAARMVRMVGMIKEVKRDSLHLTGLRLSRKCGCIKGAVALWVME